MERSWRGPLKQPILPGSQDLVWGLPPLLAWRTRSEEFLADPLGLWPPPTPLSKAGWGHVALPRPCWLQFLNQLQWPAFPALPISREAWTVGWGKPQPFPPGTHCPLPLVPVPSPGAP